VEILKSTTSHDLVLVFAGNTSFPTSSTLLKSHPILFYIIPYHPLFSPPWPPAWRCITSHVHSGSTNPSSRLAASDYALLLPSFPTLLFLSISRPSSDQKLVPQNPFPLSTITRIHLHPRPRFVLLSNYHYYIPSYPLTTLL